MQIIDLEQYENCQDEVQYLDELPLNEVERCGYTSDNSDPYDMIELMDEISDYVEYIPQDEYDNLKLAGWL